MHSTRHTKLASGWLGTVCQPAQTARPKLWPTMPSRACGQARSANAKGSGSLTVLELYSGLGGMAFSLYKALGMTSKAAAQAMLHIAAYDTNEVANKVYAHNHKHQPHVLSLERVTAQQLDDLGAELWCMSPPCQPYTTTTLAKRKDTQDTRAGSFLHLLQQLHQMANPPKYILLENVSGFIQSDGHAKLLSTLKELDYAVQEFEISPVQFCIPYLRTRYYCLAKRAPLAFLHPELSASINTVPPALPPALAQRCLPPALRTAGISVQQWTRPAPGGTPLSNPIDGDSTGRGQLVVPLATWCELTGPNMLDAPGTPILTQPESQLAQHTSQHLPSEASTEAGAHTASHTSQSPESARWPLGMFLEAATWDGDDVASEAGQQGQGEQCSVWRQHQLPRSKLAKYWKVLDLVTPDSRHSNCITKNYGKNILGSGSLLVTNAFVERFGRVDARGRMHLPTDPFQAEPVDHPLLDQIRHLSPREVARLHGLPDVPPTSQLQDQSDIAFDWPNDVSNRQMHALLGNSLSTDCVSWLLCYMMLDSSDA